jgi:micrococcal nuclease
MRPHSALTWLLVLAAVAAAGSRLSGPSGSGRGSVSSGGGAGFGADTRGGLPVAAGQTLSAVVTRVVDGDTVKVQAAGGQDTVRYIGIDTPESVKPDTPVQCFAKAASHRNAELVAGRAVRLIVGAEARDRYGRLLAYVYRAADGRFVNEELVAGGFARTLTIAPNDRFAARFAARAEAAQAAGRGLWGACGNASG